MTPRQLLQQRWALLGFGREGQALARWALKQSPRPKLVVFCEHPPAPEALALLDTTLDQVHVGPFEHSRLAVFSVLVKSPGISPLHPALRNLSASVCVTSTTNLWFAQRPHERVIAITGTKGKSTTAALTAHLLRAGGKQVELVGNIGVPVFERLDAQADWWVMELSSYQTADLYGVPELGVLLSLYPEHLDWHGGEAEYVRDKIRLLRQARKAWAPRSLHGILRTQGSDGHAGDDAKMHWLQHQTGVLVAAESLVTVSEAGAQQHLINLPELPLRGRHNAYNISVAWELARYAGIDDDTIKVALSGFRGLPHRLEELGRSGAHYAVNDSISTTPHAAMAAMAALSPRVVTILVGGHDRGVSWQAFAEYLRYEPPHAVVAMGVQGRAIAALIEQYGIQLEGGVHTAPNLSHAVALARRCTPADGTILLSPGAPSYGEFSHFEARGAAFKKRLQETAGD